MSPNDFNTFLIIPTSLHRQKSGVAREWLRYVENVLVKHFHIVKLTLKVIVLYNFAVSASSFQKYPEHSN